MGILAILVGFLAPTAATAKIANGTQHAKTAVTKAAKKAPIQKKLQSALDSKGVSDLWVVFDQKPDLSKATKIKDWKKRGDYVVKAMKAAANKSQAATKKVLKKAKAEFTPYWISNRIHVTNASEKLATTLAAQTGVKQLSAPQVMPLVKPTKEHLKNQLDAIEWGISAIKADQVWSTFGVRGEGIVVANIDTGVKYDHAALVGKYRGNLGNGTFDHNYNWFDPSKVCGNPSVTPCDWHDHGSHTMGTMTGDDGAGNQIGVAPGAKWIAAVGCDSALGCSDTALLGSGQWTLEPRDLNGQNPNTGKRPHIVSNSWGAANGGTVDPWYDDIVQGWTAAGMFGLFSNGNAGPSCNTTGSPADSPYAFGVGGFQQSGAVYGNSSRGPGAPDRIKPNISAPAVNVRSSVKNGSYGNFTGTSMAAPHVAGTVALIWSAAPALLGDVAGTRALLAQTAVDVDDTTCGGTPGNNNTWGEGKIDALAAVTQAPKGDTGTLTGTVTDATTGAPINGATVKVTGPLNRTLTTGTDGTYRAVLSAGSYSVEASAYAYGTVTATTTVVKDETTTTNVALQAVAAHDVRGTVTDARNVPVRGATVKVDGTPITPIVTGTDGSFAFPLVPDGTYNVSVTSNGCTQATSQQVVVDAHKTLAISAADIVDTFGYRCQLEGSSYVLGDTPLSLTGDDSSVAIDLPFPLVHYGNRYSKAWVGANGHINFLAASTAFTNAKIPVTATPNAALYPFWDDLFVDAEAKAYTKVSGTAPNRTFVVEWRNVLIRSAPTQRMDFEVVFEENGETSFHYRNLNPADPRERGNSATIGIEDSTGRVATLFSYNTASLADGTSIRFAQPPHGFGTGTITDRNDGLPIAGATVTISQGDVPVTTLTTASDGTYWAQLPVGTYDVVVGKTNYAEQKFSAEVTNHQTLTANKALRTGRADLEAPATIKWVMPADIVPAKKTLWLSNTGSADLTWTVDLPGAPSWLNVSATGGALAVGEETSFELGADSTDLAPGVYNGTVRLTSTSGRKPVIEVPVVLAVSSYWKALDAGSTAGSLDTEGLPWSTDVQYRTGRWGWVGASTVNTAGPAVDILNTEDDALFRSQRQGMTSYRFDKAPAGVYEVRIDYAELARSPRVDWRMFDVSVNGTFVQTAFDIADEVGGRRAITKVFYVTIPAEGGDVLVNFHARRGYQPPVVNGIRVIHRPDM